MNKLIALILFLSLPAKGTWVEFNATGRPSMIRIHGICPEASYTKKGTTLNATVKMDSCDTGIAMRNEHMQKKYLQTAKFPNAVLVAKLNGATFTGKLTLHGQTQDVNGTADDKGIQFTTKISGFAMGVPGFLGVTVADEVSVKALY